MKKKLQQLETKLNGILGYTVNLEERSKELHSIMFEVWDIGNDEILFRWYVYEAHKMSVNEICYRFISHYTEYMLYIKEAMEEKND